MQKEYYRKNPFDGEYNLKEIPLEEHVIGFDEGAQAYGIRLNYTPYRTSTYNSLIVIDENNEKYTEVTRNYKPQQREYRVDYDYDTYINTGFVECNQADAGKLLYVSYTGTGLLVKPDNMIAGLHNNTIENNLSIVNGHVASGNLFKPDGTSLYSDKLHEFEEVSLYYAFHGTNGDFSYTLDGINYLSGQTVGAGKNINGSVFYDVGNTFTSYLFGNNGTVLTDITYAPVTSNTTAHLYGGACGNDRVVLVGSSGNVSVSISGGAFFRSISGGINLNSVAYGNNKFVAVGNSGTVMRSSDGISWTSGKIGLNDFNSIIYKEKFVAVGDSGTVITSTDGISWNAQNLTSHNLNKIVNDDDRIVVVGDSGTIYTSADGVTFEDKTGITSNNIISVGLGDSGRTLISDSAGYVYATRDYKRYKTAYTGGAVSYRFAKTFNKLSVTSFFNQITSSDKYLIFGLRDKYLIRYDQTTDEYKFSSQLIDIRDITYDAVNNKFIAVRYSAPKIAYSTDGLTWTTVNTKDADSWISTIADKNGNTYIFGNSNTIYSYSTNGGATWSSNVSINLLSSNPTLFGMTADESTRRYVMVGAGGLVLYSQGGNVWKSKSITGNILQGVAYGNGTFVAVGFGGVCFTSTDAETWTARSLGTTANMYFIEYVNGLFITAGASSVMRKSTDGITWENVTAPSTATFTIAYFDGAYYAGCVTNIYKSTNLSSWTLVHTSAVQIYHVYNAGDKLIACGNNNIAYSLNGSSWTVVTPAYTNPTEFRRIVKMRNKYLCFTAENNNYGGCSSDDGITWTRENSFILSVGNNAAPGGYISPVYYESTTDVTWFYRDSVISIIKYLDDDNRLLRSAINYYSHYYKKIFSDGDNIIVYSGNNFNTFIKVNKGSFEFLNTGDMLLEPANIKTIFDVISDKFKNNFIKYTDNTNSKITMLALDLTLIDEVKFIIVSINLEDNTFEKINIDNFNFDNYVLDTYQQQYSYYIHNGFIVFNGFDNNVAKISNKIDGKIVQKNSISEEIFEKYIYFNGSLYLSTVSFNKLYKSKVPI